MIRIAIDGPGGAGKSSLAKKVAKELGIIYVDTGALYRTIGLYMLNNGISPTDKATVVENLSNISLDLKFIDGKQTILLNGTDVKETIRTPEVSMAASAVSAIGEVRAFLLETQRNIAENNSVIMDGRDIGTVIIPDAEVKIFLTASPEARAQRRYKELLAKGINTTLEQVAAEMAERDKNDSTREIAPCKKADDATELDNSSLTEKETVAAVLKIVKKVQKQRKSRGTPFYATLKFLLSPFFRLIYRVKISGKENIPKDKPYIVCCNHIGIRDVIILAACLPRQIHFLAKKEWFENPFLRSLFRSLGAIELDRGGRDVGALKNAISSLKAGKVLSIFPQGHRYPGENPANTPTKSGVALIAYRSKADILPVCLKVKDCKYGFMKPIELVIGEPIKNKCLGIVDGGYDEYREATQKIFGKVCALGGYSALPSAKDGVEEA